MSNQQNGTNEIALATRPNADAYGQAEAAIERIGFGSKEVERRRETQATAMAARAKAEVEAMFVMAMQNPRTWPTVWGQLITECQRPSFAEAAMYRLKKGRKKNEDTNQWEDNWIEGLTIGFARTAARMMGNLDIKEPVTYEDGEKLIVTVTVIDLECNVRQARDVTVTKSIERVSGDGRIVLGERRNSYGKTTYIVVPTDEEMEVKVAARVSKMRRTLINDMLPADLKDDCLATIKVTRQKGDKKDPDAAKKKLIAAYAAISITADELAKYLGHPFEQISPDEMEELRGVGAAIKEGETTWREALAEKLGADAPADAKPADTTADKLKEKLGKAAAGNGASSKPATGWNWTGEGDDARCVNGAFSIKIEQIGPREFGWWLDKEGEEIARGSGTSRGGALDAAQKAAK